MNDPFADDGWDELTRELGVEKAPPAAESFEDEAPQPPEDDPALAVSEEYEGTGESEGDAPDGAEAPGDEQPGTGKKRRRRRRRRKKGPGEGEPGEAAADSEAAAPAEGEFTESEYETGPGSDSDELVPVGAEEDTAGEVLRDLIANWNVPSWDSIITGLYRPER